MNLLQVKNKKGDKIFFRYDFGRGKGQRPSTGIFIYTKPKNQIEKNHNKEERALKDDEPIYLSAIEITENCHSWAEADKNKSSR